MLPLLPDQVTSHLLAEGPVWAAAGAPLAGVPGPGARDLPARPPGVGAVRQQGALPGPVWCNYSRGLTSQLLLLPCVAILS